MESKLTFTCVLAFLLLTAHIQSAQEKDSLSFRRPTAGFSINQVHGDFGLGLQLTSPYFGKGVALRLRGGLQWLQHIQAQDTVTTWSPYYTVSFSAVARRQIVPGKVDVYTEGGAVCILPSADLASYPFRFGGFGIFGFEFRYPGPVRQFIEVGGVGTGAVADNVPLKPVYFNGFLIMTGLRFAL